MTLTVGSLFAGVEGLGMGFKQAGFEVAWQVEIDRDAVSVLERHYPNVLRVRDVRDAGAHNLPPVDVITFGSPCQGFSVAGRGEGLEDARSGLFSEAVRIIRELRPAFALWENVPGAYSANDGRDFGAVLAALAESGALDIAWRVLDAQWFGVPQRRRRIFLVADFGGERAAQVLFEPEGSGWDSEACRAPWEGTAGGAEDGAGVAFTLRANRNGTGSADNAWNTTYIPAVARSVTAHAARIDRQGNGGPGNLIPTIAGGDTARYGKGTDSDVTDTLLIADTVRSHPRPGSNSVDNLTLTDAGYDQPAAALRCEYGAQAFRGDGSDNLITGIDWQQAGGTVEDGAPCLSTTRTPADGGRPGMAVRRLTPRECERLMGWPDDHTRWRADGIEISDGPRYRMIGNGVATPVAAWIARRLRAAMEAAV